MKEDRRESLEISKSERTLAEMMREDEDSRYLAREREDAEGLEVFSDPDRLMPARAIVEGRAGHESFSSADAHEEEIRPTS